STLKKIVARTATIAARPTRVRLPVDRSVLITHTSEQLDVDNLSLLDDVRAGGDLDVAVGERHRGDVTGGLERRYRLAVRDPDGKELMPAGRRDDPLCERQRDLTPLIGRQMGHTSQRRNEQHVGVRQTRGRI